MTQFDIFEPDLELTKPYLPYEDYGIQGVWPRNHRVPTDVFPTFSHVGGLNQDKSKVRAAGVTNDRRLMVDAALSSINGEIHPPNYSEGAVFDGDSPNPDNLTLQHVPHILYSLHVEFTVWKTLTSGSEATVALLNSDPASGFAELARFGTVWFSTGTAKNGATSVRTVDFQSAQGLDLRTLFDGVAGVNLTFNCDPNITASFSIVAYTEDAL